MNKPTFDHQLARSCAHAFYVSTTLGCIVSDTEGQILFEEGQGFTHCPLCTYTGCSRDMCTASHIYGMLEAERFGGKYIYFCPLGLTCFVSPIIGDEGTAAKITAGPFTMVEKQDFIDCELKGNLHLQGESLECAITALEQVPFIPPEQATELSNLLFMAVGFMNNVSAENELLQADRSHSLQSQISAYIARLKADEEATAAYPLLKEQALLRSIARREREQAYHQLEELLGELFLMGGNLQKLKARGYELMVMISRTAIENGADTELALDMCQRYMEEGAHIEDFSSLCSWLAKTMTAFTDSIFGHGDTKHANIIHRCIQHIGAHYAERLTLEEMADMVYISPAYLSRVFKDETGSTFNQYLNRVRVTKAKELLRDRQLKLTDICLMVGYEDQSYFTRVFKKLEGISPGRYRNKVLAHYRR
ncbi:MAG: helix-turn-helix domain-containing protein [Clostridia bacterium]|nr:helix-turn-helix domain-containing protein [Clostridia bacterium]